VAETQPTEVLQADAPAAPPRRKRRIGWVIAGIAVIVLIAGLIIGDLAARAYATNLVRERIAAVLNLPAGTPVGVELGPGSILLQAATGAIDRVDVAVDELTFGEITGSATIAATEVPIDTSRPVDRLRIGVTVAEDQVQNLAGFLSGTPLQSIALEGDKVRVAAEFDLVFLQLPVEVDLAPSAVDGGISFDPTTIYLDGEQISVDDLRAIPGVSELAGTLLASRDFCVAGYLPQALTVTDVDVVDDALVLAIRGDGAALSGPGLSTNGTCP